jgi:hypothetical protein
MAISFFGQSAVTGEVFFGGDDAFGSQREHDKQETAAVRTAMAAKVPAHDIKRMFALAGP